MNQKPFIYLRGLRHADFTVFCVADGQKNNLLSISVVFATPTSPSSVSQTDRKTIGTHSSHALYLTPADSK